MLKTGCRDTKCGEVPRHGLRERSFKCEDLLAVFVDWSSAGKGSQREKGHFVLYQSRMRPLRVGKTVLYIPTTVS